MFSFLRRSLTELGTDIPSNPLAYEFYLRSISYPITNEGDRLAIEMLNKSIELDSTFAPAYDQLGYRIHSLAQYGLLRSGRNKKSRKCFVKSFVS